MSVSIEQILASPQWKSAVERVKQSYTQTVMASGTSPEDRAKALTKYHLLDELAVDLSMHKQE